MQVLYEDGNKIEVMRSFTKDVASSHLFEFTDGSWGYKNGDRIKVSEEVEFLPEAHKTRALNYLDSLQKAKEKKEKSDFSFSENFEKMTLSQLQLLAGNDSTDRDELIKLIEREK